MPDRPKTHQTLTTENTALKERIRELEAAASERRQAEEVLRNSERLYRSLIECSSDAIFCVDKKGQYQFVNTLFATTFGKSPDYFKGKTFWDIYPKEHADYRFTTTQRVIQTGESESIEVEVPLPDKTLFFYATANPIKDETGNVVMVLTHAVDITERKRAEAALKQGEERYRNFIRNAMEGIYRIDFLPPVPIGLPEQELVERLTRNAVVGEVNEHLARMYGLSAADMIGRRATDFAPTYGERALLALRAPNFQVRDRETEDVNPNGQTVSLLENFTGVVEDGYLIHIWGMQRDITERKLAERQLQQSRQRMQLALDGTEQGFWEFDLSTTKVHYGDNWHKILGYGPEESTFDYEWYVSRIHPESFPVFEKAISDCLSGQANHIDWEYQIRDKSGQWQWVHALGTFAEPDEKGIPTKVIGTHRNITPRKRAEEALQKSNRLFEMITQNARDVIWMTDMNLQFTYMSPSIEQMLGYPLDEYLAKPYGDFILPASLDLLYQMLEEELAAEGDPNSDPHRSRTVETEQMHRNGSRLWVELKMSFMRDADGKPIGILGFSRDITNQKRAQEALRESEAKYKSLTENMHDIVWTVDLNSNITYISPSIEKVLGFTVAERLTHTVEEQMTAASVRLTSDRLAEELAFDAQRDPERHAIMELDYYHKDGSIRCLETTLSFIRDEHGKPVGIHGLSRDITDRKRAQEALQESEARYSMLAEHMTEAVWLMGTNLKTKYLSPSLERMRGYTLAEIGQLPLDKHLTPESLKFALDVFADERLKVLADPAYTPKRTLELEFLRKDGTAFWSECTLTLIRDKDGKPQSILGEGRDITERKRAEEERKKLKEQLDRAQKLESIGTLAGGVAHDFNNLLMGILGHTSMMMLDLDVSHPHHARLKHIEEQAQSGADLTQQLLGFARGGRYAVRPTDMNEIVGKTSNMFGRTKKEITIHRQFRKDLWNVEADRAQMEQVLMNLYVNAWHAMPGGGEISLQTDNVFLADKGEGFLAAGRYVKITVSDTGMGMDAQTRERIFDPFFTTKAMGRGTGLGLATVYGIIQGHKGMIDLTSEPGRGTTFDIYLPATDKAMVEEAPPQQEAPRGAETILLVDDEAIVLEVAGEMLQHLGYRVHCVGSGQEALAVYHEKKDEIALVILDMVMPGMSGGVTFDHLKQINPQVRVLLSSGYSIDGEARGILDRGCKGFLQKPFLLDKLSRHVRNVLEGNKSSKR
jgi:PAS domain S-box-containing protein